MAAFDEQLKRVGEYVAGLREQGREARELSCPSSLGELKEGLPVKVGKGANAGIILRSDTSVELGNPQAGSRAFLVWTDSPDLITDGKITVVGPDISESAGGSLPFAQILMVAGKELEAAEHESVHQGQYIADQIEGYMLKSSSQHMWGRVSNDVAAKGFSFETLGRALMVLFKSNLPKVEAVEAVFITSSKEDVLGLDELAEEVRNLGADIVKENWKARGFDLDCDLECGSCTDKEVCDDIRDVISLRAKKSDKKSGEADADEVPTDTKIDDAVG